MSICVRTRDGKLRLTERCRLQWRAGETKNDKGQIFSLSISRACEVAKDARPERFRDEVEGRTWEGSFSRRFTHRVLLEENPDPHSKSIAQA